MTGSQDAARTTRRIPILPTIVVLAAAATMVALGVWQLGRAEWKAELLARYAEAQDDIRPIAYPPDDEAAAQAAWFRRSTIDCKAAGAPQGIAGRNAKGRAGYVHIVPCTLADGGTAQVQLGWSEAPTAPAWPGGKASGTIAPFSAGHAKLVADPPLAGLEASARPDPADLPNNHMAYAWQWFLFALTALVIYALALRRRWR